MGIKDDRGYVKGQWVATFITGGVLLTLVILVGIYVGYRNIHRGQQRADAKNRVKISAIEIQNQRQRVEIAKQKAEIRLQDAVGVREAQDQIAKTLTPLYVQFEMVEALKAIAASGSNSSVVFIPSGANGIPMVYDSANATKVGNPEDK